MTISVRLDDELEKQLAGFSRQSGVSKSQIIKESLRQYLATRTQPKTAYELGEDLFGKHDSGLGDLSTHRKQYLKAKLHAKRARR
jgi:RHH-type transcriptional regulator, rel operon repressor / antitoxin RelB